MNIKKAKIGDKVWIRGTIDEDGDFVVGNKSSWIFENELKRMDSADIKLDEELKPEVQQCAADWYEDYIRTLINMHQFGYTIKKEKLYTVEIPNPNSDIKVILVKVNNKLKIISVYENELVDYDDIRNLTEKEIRKDFDWAWKWAEEVAE